MTPNRPSMEYWPSPLNRILGAYRRLEARLLRQRHLHRRAARLPVGGRRCGLSRAGSRVSALEHSQRADRGTQPRRFKVYEKAGTLRISVQDPARAGQVVKNPAKRAGQAVHAAKEALIDPAFMIRTHAA
jgi:hypothetical protein